ncbi:MAG: adenylyltransferase/cytidyltransferase family protein [Kiritimatiellales bacterium]|nr:adenylyltransferase/cytidyltransferase family protein [Kiritimatiellales bacterium]
MSKVVLSASFDNMRLPSFRLMHEASRLGDELHVVLWSDEAIRNITGEPAKFMLAERQYFVEAVRHTSGVTSSADDLDPDTLPVIEGATCWAVDEADANDRKKAFCEANGLEYKVLTATDLSGVPDLPPMERDPGAPPKKKVLVTGCFDWFHTGHVRFYEEVSEHGELYVVVGHDANIRLLKGNGHPMFPENERRYIAQSIRYVHQALVSSGSGWMDAEPEIAVIKPDAYAVNEDGDKPEKREFCKQHNLEYIVLKRTPKEGLPRRESTHLRGF